MKPFAHADLASCGISPDVLSALTAKMKKDKILGCMILRHGQIAYTYYKGPKVVNSVHHLHSATKSFVSAMVGICVSQGLILNLNTPITEYFGPAFAKDDPRKQAITLYHLLTMSEGLCWPEFGEWNFFSPMEYSRDIIGFILGREMEANPGERMNYNSGCSHLLSAVIQMVSGQKLIDFAQKHLFKPLGITECTWYEKQKVNLGANGLNMKMEDMLKFGFLYLNNGTIDGNEIIPAGWVAESTKPRLMTYPDIGAYAMHWWTSQLQEGTKEAVPYYFAMGLFGQFIIVVPKYDMVVVFVSENYGETIRPMQYFREYIAMGVEGEGEVKRSYSAGL